LHQKDLESAIASFCASGSFATPGEALLLPSWCDEDWKQLFRFTSTRGVMAGDALILPSIATLASDSSPISRQAQRTACKLCEWRGRCPSENQRLFCDQESDGPSAT
jgi:hypothetical protein